MGDEDRSRELPQRQRGAARAGPAPAGPPVLSEELRQRIRAAVQAERGRAEGQDQELGTKPERRATVPGTADGGVTSPAVNGIDLAARPERGIKSGHTPRSAKSERIARSAKSKRTAAPAELVKPEPAATPKPAHTAPAGHKSVSVPRMALPARPAERARPAESARAKPVRRPFGSARLVVSALVVIAAASLGVGVARYIATSRADRLSSAQQHQDAVARTLAARWVAQQVSRGAVVSCDEVMCKALEEDGMPSGNLLVLGSTSPYPRTAAVVVETAAVRSIFGSSLNSDWAPATLATFGSGNAQITIRVIAPNGAAAYYRALAADLANRVTIGKYLLTYNNVTLSAAARTQLTAGQPDSRLLLAIEAVATSEPIDIVQFGNTGPGADAGIPLCSADLAENGQPAHMSTSAYVRSLRTYLDKVPALVRPASIETVVVSGQAVLRIEFTAPSPLGLLGPSKSP
jgi:hypothetical protein